MRKLVLILIIFGFSALKIVPVSAVTVDQGDTLSNWTYSSTSYLDRINLFGQSFTPAVDNVHSVDIFIRRSDTYFRDLNLTLATTFNGDLPTAGEIIGFKSVLYSDISTTNAYHTIVFDTPISVTPSTTYWLVPVPNDTSPDWCYAWRMDMNNPYAGGQASSSSAWDFWFRTYYDETLPELPIVPSILIFSSALMLVILVLVTRHCRRT